MDRRNVTKIIGAVSASVVAGANVAAKRPAPSESERSDIEMSDHAVQVCLDEDVGTGPVRQVIVTAPYKDHLVRVKTGDLVRWEFVNRSKRDLTPGIGHFRAPARWARVHEPREIPLEPLESDGKFSVQVPAGTTGSLVCRVKEGINAPRTYAYDIIEFGTLRVMLDPEIEIEKP